MSKCITCYRCVRICEEVQGQFVWQILNRGHETRIVPDSGAALGESSCVSCGACVDTCPSVALEDKSILEREKSTNWTRTTCPYCGTDCELNVGTHQNQIVSIKPVPTVMRTSYYISDDKHEIAMAYVTERLAHMAALVATHESREHNDKDAGRNLWTRTLDAVFRFIRLHARTLHLLGLTLTA